MESLVSKDFEQANLFKNRLVKLARHLRRWPTKRGISCYRLYERDIPEIPLVVDRYEDHLHITEYERPHDRSPERHAAWLELMAGTASESLGILPVNTHLKSRVRQAEQTQYEKLGDAREFFVVQEDGLKFLVNFSDYVDTGLFLDHRETRKMVRRESAGKAVLNLFAYTGSFSVYAAAGQAKSTTTVDLSKTYLQWAKRNFQLNQLQGEQHDFVQSDSFGYLESLAAAGDRQFDLAIVDPPTYSNSKRTEKDWNVQANHAELLQTLRTIMCPRGVVYFSTNYRRFQLNENATVNFQVREISKQTVPEDFRNRRIHRCWRMVVT
jgi:23S rRNA (guanine2445-N2)-methyltransferase / 23S rRNA (guanine2069-N7)-methyltransferase